MTDEQEQHWPEKEIRKLEREVEAIEKAKRQAEFVESEQSLIKQQIIL